MTDLLAVCTHAAWSLHTSGLIDGYDHDEIEADVDYSTSEFDGGVYIVSTVTRWTATVLLQEVRA